MNSNNLWKICLSRKDNIGSSAFFPSLFFNLTLHVWAYKWFLKEQDYLCIFFFSIRMSKLLWVRNPLANHPHQPRPIQIQGMPIGYCRKQNYCQKVKKSTGQSASPSLERLPRSSPTTQPSQWWGTSIKYLKNEEETKKNRAGPFLTSDFLLPLYTLGGHSRS